MNSLAGLILVESVHVADDETARNLRRTAVAAGATVDMVVEALALRDEYHAGHVVTVVAS